MTKIKADPDGVEAPAEACCGERTYHELLANLNPIAQPLASIMVLAGDTLPIEVYCHLPVMCEDRNLPYAYVPSKTDLGAAAGSKRPTCVIMVKPHEEYQEAYDECLEEVRALPAAL
ncbi:H/ACA ribonucleoprotein complex subunit 2 [Carlito syrichta]|uniref:H/ACA ribonucleoprotein complex subunit 2 n=1 Tax=Carlito syrichta TaxID=1868482 RepID=A0A3Q0DW64_CARSF|nr:H/ACA ribonucleoprotein complex subunit 2 [Carlito syrichta]